MHMDLPAGTTSDDDQDPIEVFIIEQSDEKSEVDVENDIDDVQSENSNFDEKDDMFLVIDEMCEEENLKNEKSASDAEEGDMPVLHREDDIADRSSDPDDEMQEILQEICKDESVSDHNSEFKPESGDEEIYSLIEEMHNQEIDVKEEQNDTDSHPVVSDDKVSAENCNPIKGSLSNPSIEVSEGHTTSVDLELSPSDGENQIQVDSTSQDSEFIQTINNSVKNDTATEEQCPVEMLASSTSNLETSIIEDSVEISVEELNCGVITSCLSIEENSDICSTVEDVGFNRNEVTCCVENAAVGETSQTENTNNDFPDDAVTVTHKDVTSISKQSFVNTNNIESSFVDLNDQQLNSLNLQMESSKTIKDDKLLLNGYQNSTENLLNTFKLDALNEECSAKCTDSNANDITDMSIDVETIEIVLPMQTDMSIKDVEAMEVVLPMPTDMSTKDVEAMEVVLPTPSEMSTKDVEAKEIVLPIPTLVQSNDDKKRKRKISAVCESDIRISVCKTTFDSCDEDTGIISTVLNDVVDNVHKLLQCEENNLMEENVCIKKSNIAEYEEIHSKAILTSNPKSPTNLLPSSQILDSIEMTVHEKTDKLKSNHIGKSSAIYNCDTPENETNTDNILTDLASIQIGDVKGQLNTNLKPLLVKVLNSDSENQTSTDDILTDSSSIQIGDVNDQLNTNLKPLFVKFRNSDSENQTSTDDLLTDSAAIQNGDGKDQLSTKLKPWLVQFLNSDKMLEALNCVKQCRNEPEDDDTKKYTGDLTDEKNDHKDVFKKNISTIVQNETNEEIKAADTSTDFKKRKLSGEDDFEDIVKKQRKIGSDSYKDLDVALNISLHNDIQNKEIENSVESEKIVDSKKIVDSEKIIDNEKIVDSEKIVESEKIVDSDHDIKTQSAVNECKTDINKEDSKIISDDRTESDVGGSKGNDEKDYRTVEDCKIHDVKDPGTTSIVEGSIVSDEIDCKAVEDSNIHDIKDSKTVEDGDIHDIKDSKDETTMKDSKTDSNIQSEIINDVKDLSEDEIIEKLIADLRINETCVVDPHDPDRYLVKPKAFEGYFKGFIEKYVAHKHNQEMAELRKKIEEKKKLYQEYCEKLTFFRERATELNNFQQAAFAASNFNPKVSTRTVGVNVQIYRECDVKRPAPVPSTQVTGDKSTLHSKSPTAATKPLYMDAITLPSRPAVAIRQPVPIMPAQSSQSAVRRPLPSIISNPVRAPTSTVLVRQVPTAHFQTRSRGPATSIQSITRPGVQPQFCRPSLLLNCNTVTRPTMSNSNSVLLITPATSASTSQLIDLTDDSASNKKLAHAQSRIITGYSGISPSVNKVNLPQSTSSSNVLVPIVTVPNFVQLVPTVSQASPQQLIGSSSVPLPRQPTANLPSNLVRGRTVTYIVPPNSGQFAGMKGPVPSFVSAQGQPVRTVFVRLPSTSGAGTPVSNLQRMPASSTTPSSTYPSSGLVLMTRTSQHPAPLPPAPTYSHSPALKLIPPKPALKGSKATSGIVLSWNMNLVSTHAAISKYQLYAYQESNVPVTTSLWKKVGDVKALPLPMACTLTQFVEGNKYYFAVRAVDEHARIGPFSDPVAIPFLTRSNLSLNN